MRTYPHTIAPVEIGVQEIQHRIAYFLVFGSKNEAKDKRAMLFAILFDIFCPTSILVKSSKPYNTSPKKSPKTGCNFDGFYLDSFARLAVLA